MLRSLVPLLRCPTCKRPDAALELAELQPGEEGHVADGVLICRQCSAWYPIERYMLECVPAPLLDTGDLDAFWRRFGDELAGLGLDRPSAGDDGSPYSPQVKQREHFDLYAEEAPGFADYNRSPFIQATAKRYFDLWEERLTKPGAWLLDIGCGTAIHSWRFARQRTLIGFDISRKAIRKANEQARAAGLLATTTFYVGDGSSLPFRDESFQYVQTGGVLHHLPDPGAALREIFRVLAPGGLHYAVENNRSAFRAVFDLLMKVRPLWIEEAGAMPLFTRADVDGWTRGLPVRLESSTSVFLPPHLINRMGRWRDAALEWSDRLAAAVPWWRHQGGILLFTMEKLDETGAAAHPPAPPLSAADRTS